MIKLSIVVPYHNEPWEKIQPTFECLNNQIEINPNEIEIIVVNNCENPIKPINLFNGTYPHLPTRFVLNNEYINSIGMSCQKGIKEALGQFILFMDSDDLLYDNKCLSDCIKIINQYSDYDLIVLKNIQEIIKDDKSSYYLVDGKPLRSGKLYRRDFILDNLITHLSTVEYSEDTLFSIMVDMHNPKTINVDRLFYIHTFNKESTTRKNFNEFVDKASLDFIKGIDIISRIYYNGDESFVNTLNEYIEDFGKRMYNCLGKKQPDILTAVCKYLVEKNINKKDE